MRTALVMLGLLLIAGNAQALQIIVVNTMNVVGPLAADKPIFSSQYSYNFANTVFPPGDPLYHGYSLLNYDFGEIHVGQTVHNVLDTNISGVNIEIRGSATKNWLGFGTDATSVYVNGTHAWDALGECSTGSASDIACTVFGGTFGYRDTLMLMYAENQTAFVPITPTGTPCYAFQQSGCIPTGGAVPNLTGLFWVQERAVSRHLNPQNSTGFTTDAGGGGFQGVFWLANVSHPTQWDFSTNYPDRTPTSLSYQYQFYNQTQFLTAASIFQQNNKACGGLSAIIQNLIGVCPTITGLVAKSIEFIPNILGTLLGFVNPEAGHAVKLLGQIAGDFVGAYVFLLLLVTTNIGQFFVWIAFTVSFFSFLIGGLRGDLGSILHGHMMGFKVLGYIVFGYFWILYMIGKFIIILVMRIVSAIGEYVPKFL